MSVGGRDCGCTSLPAFFRALDLIPFLLGSILKYFEDAPAPFERFVRCGTFSKTDAMGANQLLNVVRASYGLLMTETDIFMSFWDWSCYLDLLQKYPNSVSLNYVDLRNIISDVRLNDFELREIVSDIRWCSIEILSLVLGLSFEASANLGRDSEQSIHRLLRWQEFCMEVSLEKGSWYLESPIQETLAMVGRRADRIVLSDQTCTIDKRNLGNPFFLTSNITKSFEMVSLAVSQRWPVLLYGPSGSGKTAIINDLANSHGSRVLQLHMDEQIDGKTLIGSYVCTEQPGEFRWQPGSLTQLKSCHVLINLIKCASQLRLSLRQWSSEDCSNQMNATQRTFIPVLTSLRIMEEKVLHVLAESPSFDLLFESFCDLLEHHKLFWNSIISSHFDCQLIYWRSLMKDVLKLYQICPVEAKTCQIKMKELEGLSSLHLNSRKSLLWTYGGHPILPPSAELYQKQCQLSSLCELVWPRKNEFVKLCRIVVDDASSDDNDTNEVTLAVALSSNIELRLLAMQGVCMSSYIIGKADDDDFDCILQLEEMYQVLLGRMDFEKQKLKVRVDATKHQSGPAHCSACCLLTSDALCRKSGFECWLKTQPLVDETTFFLDLELLQHLTEIAVVDTEEHDALSDMAGDLESCLNFSLNYSSRPPTDFLPHQKIIWTLDAWASVDRVSEKVSSFILEMWLKWHVTLWETCPMLAEIPGYDTLIPHKLFQPLKSVLVGHILQNTGSVREYLAHMLKLRVASHNIWHSSANVVKSHDMLLSAARSLFQQVFIAARSLFQQIIYTHKKSFEDSSFAKIRSAFQSIQRSKNPKENIKNLVSLLGSSNHHVFTSWIDSVIEPLLNELYPLCPSDEQSIGYALLRIGCLRYNLLICCDDLDPTVKYSIKCSELKEMIASLELEIEVRKECMYLAGSTPLGEASIFSRINLLERLHAERRTLIFWPCDAELLDALPDKRRVEDGGYCSDDGETSAYKKRKLTDMLDYDKWKSSVLQSNTSSKITGPNKRAKTKQGTLDFLKRLPKATADA